MKRWIASRGPFLLGALFLCSGAYKLIHPGEAAYALASFDAFHRVATGIVITITVLELYLGSLLLLRSDLKFALGASTVLIFVFTLFLWYLSTMAHPPACGCMGLTGMFHSTKKAAIFGVGRNCVILWILKQSYDFYFPKEGSRKQPEPVGGQAAA